VEPRDVVLAMGPVYGPKQATDGGVASQGDGGLPFFDGGLRFRTMLRSDELNWNIGVPGVNVLSELSWKDVESTGLEIGGHLDLPYGFVALGRASYGKIRDGKNQDSDFEGNNRTGEVSRSNNDGGQGKMLESQVALGYRFAAGPLELNWTPMIGYAYNEQRLNMSGGNQTIPNEGPFSGLDSDYETEWFGPFLGLQLGFAPHSRVHVSAGLEWHPKTRYRAVANWNLRPDFAHPESFKHRADGSGTVLRTEIAWQMTRRWTIDLTARWLDFETDAGRDVLFFDEGGSETSRLNEVNWKSLQLVLGASLKF
jgi:hypothetical protein